jgi:hypothetical protein
MKHQPYCCVVVAFVHILKGVRCSCSDPMDGTVLMDYFFSCVGLASALHVSGQHRLGSIPM